MMDIKWSAPSTRDLHKIEAHIAQDDAKASVKVVLSIIDKVESLLPLHPAAGRPGSVFNTRELVLSRYPYKIVYQVRGKVLYVLRVLHTAQKWP